MRVKLYVGGDLAYDNYLPSEEGCTLHSLSISESINKGGTATVLLPADHPRRDSFRPYSVPVEIYRDGKLRWRGRPLPLNNEDVYGRKTIICEGELCFLQDAIHRPYTYSGEAKEVFEQVLSVYNAAVEPWKRFCVGVVSVAGIADIANKNPENCLEVLQRLIAARGGYILFDSAADGTRQINWFADFPYTCNQTVRYGYNLTDYSRKDGSSGFATRIIPYGKADKDGQRLKINIDGKDYVENAEAIAEYGVVERSVTYNDIDDPDELRLQAERDVGIYGLVPAVITMSAIDMSRQDLALDAFAVGQAVPAESQRHNLNGKYYLTGITEDLVNPKAGGITLQRELASIGSAQEQTLSAAVAASRKGVLSAASDQTDMSIASLTHEFIFNKLTNNGAIKGIYSLDGQLYVNASYLAGGAIASPDGRLKIDLTGATMPIFNTGISTNGILVRGDISDADEVFSVEAKKSEKMDHPYLNMLFKSAADGALIGRLVESFTKDFSDRIGVAFLLQTADGKHEIRLTAENGCAALWLFRDGNIVGSIRLGEWPNGAPGIAFDGLDQLNKKRISWESNGDGTFTLIGKDA